MNVMQQMMTKMPGFISCKELDEKLDDYVEGELSLWDRLRFAGHFMMCKACVAYVAGYRKTVGLLKTSMGDPDHPAADEAVPEDLVQDIVKKQIAADTDQ